MTPLIGFIIAVGLLLLLWYVISRAFAFTQRVQLIGLAFILVIALLWMLNKGWLG